MMRLILSSVYVVVMSMVLPTASAMNKAELVEAIAKTAELTKADAKHALDAFVTYSTSNIEQDRGPVMVGFGSFSVTKRTATNRLNQTGAVVKIGKEKVGYASKGDDDFCELIFVGMEKELRKCRKGPAEHAAWHITMEIPAEIIYDYPIQATTKMAGHPYVIEFIPPDPIELQKSTEAEFKETDIVEIEFDIARAAINPREGDQYAASALKEDFMYEFLSDVYDFSLDDNSGTVLAEQLALRGNDLCPAIATKTDALSKSCLTPNEGKRQTFAKYMVKYMDKRSDTFSESEYEKVLVARDVIFKNMRTQMGTSLSGDSGLVGFGSFSVSKRAARTGRNPQTGKEIKIAAKNVVRFKAGSELSGKVN